MVWRDKLDKNAVKRFKFSEVNGINLGFSESRYGAGLGKQLREQVISDAFLCIHSFTRLSCIYYNSQKGGTIVTIGR